MPPTSGSTGSAESLDNPSLLSPSSGALLAGTRSSTCSWARGCCTATSAGAGPSTRGAGRHARTRARGRLPTRAHARTGEAAAELAVLKTHSAEPLPVPLAPPGLVPGGRPASGGGPARGFWPAVRAVPCLLDATLVRLRGLEPRTCGLRVRCSAIELEAHREVYAKVDVPPPARTSQGRRSKEASTRSAPQNPSAPSPTASAGAGAVPRQLASAAP